MLLIILVYVGCRFHLSQWLRLGDRSCPGRQTPPPAVKNETPAVAAENPLSTNPDGEEPTFAFTEMMFVNAVAQVVIVGLGSPCP